jgi:UDP-N-acetylmuramyl pentapeptide phosphotransferase/UDP-N-acetylglucosamine-1-phosphate transferase
MVITRLVKEGRLMYGMPVFGGYGGYGGYGGFDEGFADFIIGFVLLFGVFLFIGAAISITMYILRSIALYKLAARRGLSNPGLAWIPTIGLYRAGTIADDINAREGSRTYYGRMILGGYIFSAVVSNTIGFYYLSSVMSFLSEWSYWGSPEDWYESPYSMFRWFNPLTNLFNGIAGLVGLAAYVMLVISLHRIFKAYRPQSATAWTVLSAIPFTAFLQPFFLFAIRNAEPVPEWRDYYPPGPPGPPPPPPPHPMYGPVYPPDYPER